MNLPTTRRINPRSTVNDSAPLDEVVDRVFGEPVVLKPMKATSGGYRDAVPDETRQEIIARGIYDQTRGAVEATGGGMTHSQATVDTTLSIRQEPLRLCGLKKFDHVFFPERLETYEVSFIFDEASGRPDVHLVRVPV